MTQNKTDWLLKKKNYLSATEFVVIMSHCEQFDHFGQSIPSLIYQKKFMTQEQYLKWNEHNENKYMKAGKKNEKEILIFAATNLGLNLKYNSNFITHEDESLRSGSTPDAFILENDFHVGVVELKYTTQSEVRQNDGYKHQVRFQLFTAGLERGILFIAKKNINGYEVVNQEEIFLNEEEKENIKEKVLEFWKFYDQLSLKRCIELMKKSDKKQDKKLLTFIAGFEDETIIIKDYILLTELEQKIKQLEYSKKMIKDLSLIGEYKIGDKSYKVDIEKREDLIITEDYKQKQIEKAESLKIGEIYRDGAVKINIMTSDVIPF